MITLYELRQIVRVHLLEEAGVVDLANRQLSHIAIVTVKTSLIAVSTSEVVIHEGVPVPKVLGMAQADHEQNKDYRLRRLYADTAATSIVLLAAALEHWKRLLPDHSVSPAAQQVIKRYFEQNKGDPTRIELGGDLYKDDTNEHADFLKAAYLGPVGFDISRALSLGEKAIDNALTQSNDWTRDNVYDMVIDAAYNGFDQAYSDDVKTKRSFDDLFSDEASGLEGNWYSLFKALAVGIQSGGTNKSKAVAWAQRHADELLDIVEDLKPRQDKRDAEIERWWISTILPNLD